MRKKIIGPIAALALTFGMAGGADADPVIYNAGFESPGVGTGYTYDPSVASQGGAGWTFVSSSGIAGNGSAFGVYGADGNQAAFIQSSLNSGNSFSQDVSGFVVGTQYTLSFLAEGRPNSDYNGTNPIDVSVGGSLLTFNGTTTVSPTQGAGFINYTSDAFLATSTTETIVFAQISQTPNDQTTFIDDVGLTASVPEPSSIVLVGLAGAIGSAYAIRRRKRAVVA